MINVNSAAELYACSFLCFLMLYNKTIVDRAVTLQHIAPTYEKFRENVGVRCIRWGYVFHKLRTLYHTLAYAGERCHTSNLSENFVHAQNFQRMPTY